MAAFPGTLVWCLITGVLLSFAAACSGSDMPSAGPSGIKGMVTIGPTCPESRDAEDCEREPYEAKLIITNLETGEEAARVQSAKDGIFRVELAPGEYVVGPAKQNNLVPPYADPQKVAVREGEFTAIEIAYDSGIR